MSSEQRAGWQGRLAVWRERTAWLPPLLARLVLAAIFVQSGWGKLHNLPQVIDYFKSLGIPAPALQAPFVAGVEFVGGLLLIVGLLTRLSAFLLAGTMAVAILTAKLSDVHSIGGFANLPEVSFLVLLLWLVWEGGGKASLDALIAGYRRKPT
jgi:putative oxidoreductase